MNGEVVPIADSALLDLLEQERDALYRGDVRAVLAIAERKLAALDAAGPSPGSRVRELAAQNREMIAHLAESLRSVLIVALSPNGALYLPCGGMPPRHAALRRRPGNAPGR